MFRQAKGLDHHLLGAKTNMAFLAFRHPRDNILTYLTVGEQWLQYY